MASSAQTIANRKNSSASTGPRTVAGKAASAANGTKAGLFSKRDFVRPEERPLWEQLRSSLLLQLRPVGVLEETFADEIVSANWRLRRCSIVESSIDASIIDDGQGGEFVHPVFLSVDRARAQANRMLSRSMAQLKTLQNERLLRQDTMSGEDCSELGLASLRAHTIALASHTRAQGDVQASQLGELLHGIDMEASTLMRQSHQEFPLPEQKTRATKRSQSPGTPKAN